LSCHYSAGEALRYLIYGYIFRLLISDLLLYSASPLCVSFLPVIVPSCIPRFDSIYRAETARSQTTPLADKLPQPM
ncbi:hypothetical protein, partial [Enterobacter sp. R1(2018)]|uniref:hypothetical protein n=1 Tax=Enterobacter sp. R1(2018) TaxID=2447891 RepID=UPI001C7CDF24